MYGALVALTTVVFAVIAYLTVSNELYQNLDASLYRASSSLLAVIRKEQQQVQKPLKPVRRGSRSSKQADIFEFLRRSSMRNFVGPIRVPDSVAEDVEDPVWSAVYEHVLLNSSTYVLQVVNKAGSIVWRSDNLLLDSLPRFSWFESHGGKIQDDRILTNYTVQGTRYRLVVMKGDVAEVSAAYPVAEVDATLRRLFALMLYSIPAVIIFSIVVGWFLSRRSLKPVDTITRMAQRITAQRLSERLPVTNSNDEITRLSAMFNDMIARLERSFEQVKQFTSDASHELKTPLAILMGELELALRKPLSEDSVRATLESCLEEVERLNVVVQGLLEISYSESGQASMETELCDMSQLVADVCADMTLMAEQKHIELRYAINNNSFVVGDKIRLHQMCLNVIENAIKYTGEGGWVNVILDQNDEYIVLSVEDNGVGISQDQLPFIYDRFYRVDKARSKSIPGSGLGLSIVRWIVEAHKGTIEATSEEGKGTTFVISIPRA